MLLLGAGGGYGARRTPPMVTPPDLSRADWRLHGYIVHLHRCAGYAPTTLYLSGGARRPSVTRASVARLVAAGLIVRTERGGWTPTTTDRKGCPWH